MMDPLPNDELFDRLVRFFEENVSAVADRIVEELLQHDGTSNDVRHAGVPCYRELLERGELVTGEVEGRLDERWFPFDGELLHIICIAHGYQYSLHSYGLQGA